MRPAILLAALSFFWAAPLNTQQVSFVGFVRDSHTGLPIPGAAVEIVEQGIAAHTDSVGHFRLDGIKGGLLTVRVRRLGYSMGEVTLEMTAARYMTVDLGTVQLSRAATALDPVVVEGERIDDRLHKVGFFRRRQAEAGTFLTYEDIAEQNPTQTSELLRRVPGFRVFVGGWTASTRGVPSMSQGFDQCGVQYYIDGVHADGSNLDTVLPNAIAGMEIYTGAAAIPPKYRTAGNPKCGVVLIWTRSGGRRP